MPLNRWLRLLPWYDAEAGDRKEEHSIALAARADRVLDRVEKAKSDYRRTDKRLER